MPLIIYIGLPIYILYWEIIDRVIYYLCFAERYIELKFIFL